MIVFRTILIGLVFGIQSVTLMVAPQVKSVDVRLDGATVGVVSAEPWIVRCDFGVDPHPHELVAIARDVSGREIGRARQWVNLPRAAAEATLLVERGPQPSQVVAARLTWNEVRGTEPKAVRVTLDGKALAVKDPRRFELPACDARQVHILSAELVFPEGRTARADAVFGGDLGEETRSELTAVPVALEPGRKLPALSELQAWFREDDRPLRVLGVEEGPFDVVLLMDPEAQRILARESGAKAEGAPLPNGRQLPGRLLVFNPAGHGDDRLFVGFPEPERTWGQDRSEHVVFTTHPPVEFVTSDLRARLANLVSPPDATSAQTLADAMVTKGTLAAAGNRPRAAVLLRAGSRGDASAVTPAGARGYLADLHVPLVVWSMAGNGEADGWGPAVDVSSVRRMDQAAKELKGQLAMQRIVWIEGGHLPQRIRLAGSVIGAHLVP